MGLGFTGALFLMGAVREILGSGSIMGVSLFGAAFEPALLFVLAPGGFITYGLLLGGINAIVKKLSEKKEGKKA